MDTLGTLSADRVEFSGLQGLPLLEWQSQAGIETVQLLYRPTFDSEWEIYPYAEVSPFGNGGLARLDLFLPGDYTLANVFMDVSTEQVMAAAEVSISPNPVQDQMRVVVDYPNATSDYHLQLFSLSGQLIREASYPQTPKLETQWSLAGLLAGTYVLNISNGDGFRAIEVIVQ